MEATDSKTLEEILAGYTGEDKTESTLNEINNIKDFLVRVFEELISLINEIKAFFA